MNCLDKELELNQPAPQNYYDLQDSDQEDKNHCLPENKFFCQQIANHKFVIGISKPGQQRIGLQTISKNKITVKGILGINEQL
ncbi:unnamed protein product [Paramecium sonneborni]|uniref:Uncharacterized protein n=1 Tax=Paramecium sonneborni TaxID=65129 RepID=A0A8S1R5P7_9CILI|nr:unnamed protein product [Paramecium sonneborni]